MEQIRIDLGKYKSGTVYTGRPQGKSVRQAINLDSLDKDKNKEVCFVLPGNTSSFNPSFFLGLLYDSIKILGMDKFREKYHFELSQVVSRRQIQENIEDGLRNARNFLDDKTSLSLFID